MSPVNNRPTATSAPRAFITESPATLAAWVAAIAQREIPVLSDTDALLDELRPNEDAVDAHLVADVVVVDPLMTLKLLRWVAALRAGRDESNPETTTEALVMLGISPFFRHFKQQPTIEQALASIPAALLGLRQVMRRAHRAAAFALGFAVHRGDYDAPQIHEAALLHDFAEMLLWAHAPTQALALKAYQASHPQRRSVEAQQAVLHIALGDLQQALMTTWRLPPLLVQITDDHDSPRAQVRNVQLAIRLARHSAQGWDHPALADDVEQIADLLTMGVQPTLKLLHELNS